MSLALVLGAKYYKRSEYCSRYLAGVENRINFGGVV